MRRSDVESIICCQRHACAFGCQKPTFTIGWQGLACRGKYSDTTITLLAHAAQKLFRTHFERNRWIPKLVPNDRRSLT
eukprot:scaffold34444_cov22-Tisochrysis_lutea.AAC.3